MKITEKQLSAIPKLEIKNMLPTGELVLNKACWHDGNQLCNGHCAAFDIGVGTSTLRCSCRAAGDEHPILLGFIDIEY